ncbi:MAG: Protein of unknown function (DUF3288) [Phormidesmis priestleyi Ana]|uniref:Uncharacterized protein n=1 Tax=Phormidesmis priestleyi Ana TaxID=1666911 RepID=A0A0P7ZZL0_9CYAN|nr:MAG: Protein of unknown function (DUF3288) [Phormidesmis priestleyi Ana]
MDFLSPDIPSSAAVSASYFAALGVESVVGVDAMVPGAGSYAGSCKNQGIALPFIQTEAFISQRHEVNPAIALNLLQEIQTAVSTWQIQQRQIVQAMQLLYAQGPMIDGWLQSCLPVAPSTLSSADSTIFRHGDTEALMQYVEAMESSHRQTANSVDGAGDGAGDRTGVNHANADNPDKGATQYLLCSLSKDGTVRSHPCPPEQMATISTAIARYQKFKQLIAQKHAVEAKLQQLVGGLTQVRSQIQK